MNQLEIWLLAIGLAMDCLAVSITSGLILSKVDFKIMLSMAFLFGFFQAGMPLVGWIATNHFNDLIADFDHWIVFLLLLFLGGKMIKESFEIKNKEDEPQHNLNSIVTLFVLSIATSIDALAVGISFACLGMVCWLDILYAIFIIGFVSFFFSLGGFSVGLHLGKKTNNFNVELIGGLILIFIGSKILIEHLFFQ